MAVTLEERKAFIKTLLTGLTEHVFEPIEKLLQAHPEMRRTLNPAFPWPNIIKFGFLDKGLAIEYQGPAKFDRMSLIHIEDSPASSLAAFLDMDEEQLAKSQRLYLGVPAFNTNCYLGEAITRLNELSYDYTSSGEIMSINGYDDIEQAREPSFWSNVTLFWTSGEADELRVRHVDFLQFFPLDDEGDNYKLRFNFSEMFRIILELPTPEFDVQRHNDLNRFIELLHMDDVSEPDITSFLEDVPQLLQLGFGFHELNPQVTLEWQFETDIPNLRPDFMPIGMDGYANILDFKLMNLKGAPIVGQRQRRHPSFEVDSAIAQLAQYEAWCSQEVNRRWLLESKGIPVLEPLRFIVMGSSRDFPADQRQRLRATRSTHVYTYDEFIDMVRFQIYRLR